MTRGVVLGICLTVLVSALVRRLAAWWCYQRQAPAEMRGRSYW